MTNSASLVEVSPSTVIRLNVASASSLVTARSQAGLTRASVTTNARVVAMLGAIMPAPLAQPTTTAPSAVATWILGPLSVVRIASAKSGKPSGESAARGGVDSDAPPASAGEPR